MDAMSGTTSQPNSARSSRPCAPPRARPGSTRRAYASCPRTGSRCATPMAPSRASCAAARASLRPRHAGRAVHEIARAGRSLGIDDSHWRSRPRLRRGQRHVRRHRQGDADLQGRGRSGDHDGHQRTDARAGRGSGCRGGVPGERSRVFHAISQPHGGFRRRCRPRCSRARTARGAPGETLPPLDLRPSARRPRRSVVARSRTASSPAT